MEKLVTGITAALTGWLSYLHLSRPSRKECLANHALTDEKFHAVRLSLDNINSRLERICKKQDDMYKLILELLTRKR